MLILRPHPPAAIAGCLVVALAAPAAAAPGAALFPAASPVAPTAAPNLPQAQPNLSFDASPTPTTCHMGLRAANRPAEPPDALASAIYPIIVHYDAAYAPNQAQMAADTLAALELSWSVQVDQMGFRAPVLPDAQGGPELDVYLVEYAFGTAFVAADDYSDDTVGDGYNGTSTYMVIDARLPSAWLASYAAHEFNHVCQYATDFSEWSLPIWEATATSAQEWTLGAAGKWDYDVGHFQEATLWPALIADSYQTYYVGGVGYLYEYGASLWVQHLDQKLGNDDGLKGVALWEGAANEGFALEPDVVDAYVTAAGMPLGDAMNSLAISRFLVADDWDDRGLHEAEGWGPREKVPAWTFDSAALPKLAEVLPDQPMITGQAFIDVDLGPGLGLDPSAGDPWLRIRIDSALAMDSGLVVMWWDDAGLVGDVATWGSSPEIELPAQGLTRVALGVTNLGPLGWDGDDGPFKEGALSLTIEPYAVPRLHTGDTGAADTGAEDTGAEDTAAADTGAGDTGTGPTTDEPGTPTVPDPEPEPPGETGTEAERPSADAAKSGCGCDQRGAHLAGVGWLVWVAAATRRRRGGRRRG